MASVELPLSVQVTLVCGKREGPITYVLCSDLHLSES